MVATCYIFSVNVLWYYCYTSYMYSLFTFLLMLYVEEWVYTCLPDQNYSAIYTIFIPKLLGVAHLRLF